MMMAVHTAGFEVIIDVVYKHTVEVNHQGPTYSLKELNTPSVYVFSGNADVPYRKFSSTENSFAKALSPFNLRNMDAVIGTVFVVNRHYMAGPPRLHPLRDHDPSFIGCNSGDAEVAKPCTAFRDKNLFGAPNDVEFFAVDTCDKQWCAMTEDVIVVGAFTCVDKIELIIVSQPVLLSVVVAEIITIVERPSASLIVSQPVTAAGDVSVIVVSKRQEESTAGPGNGRLVQTAFDVNR